MANADDVEMQPSCLKISKGSKKLGIQVPLEDFSENADVHG